MRPDMLCKPSWISPTAIPHIYQNTPMKRRTLLKRAAGLGLVGLIGSQINLHGNETGATAAPGAAPLPTPPDADRHAELTSRIATYVAGGGGTLELGDGIYAISRPLLLPASVSLVMTPNAVIRARPGFVGDAVVIKVEGDASKFSHNGGWIRGGVIDAGKLPITGLRIDKCSFVEIADLVVLNALFKGIHITAGGCETNLSRIRVDVDLDTRYAPGSIGVHYERHDCMAHHVHIIGYETGFRTDGSTSQFSGIHVWNDDSKQGPMLHNFYINGHSCTFTQCYADSPTIAGFYVNGYHNSITQSRIYYSRWAKDNEGAGILITPDGKHGNYLGNVMFANPEHRLAKAFDGDLEGATILGNTTCYIKSKGRRPGGVVAGFANRIPSGEEPAGMEGSFGHTPLVLGGTGFRMTPQATAPTPEQGQLGEVRWVDDGETSALWLKTARGWKKSTLI
jgi:hypothetical protein